MHCMFTFVQKRLYKEVHTVAFSNGGLGKTDAQSGHNALLGMKKFQQPKTF